MTAPPFPPKPMEAKMSDQNNAPELPARIWAWSEDDDFLRAKPHGVLHGTEYIRADRAAPEGQVRAKIEGLIEDAIANAEVDYPAGREAGHSITWDSDRLLDDIIAAITPPPAAPTDNTALVEEQRMKEHYRNCWKAQLERANGLEAALASREAPPAAQEPVARIREYLMKHDHHSPPACQQEAVTVALKLAAARLQRLALGIPSTTPLRADVFEWAEEALRALKGENNADHT